MGFMDVPRLDDNLLATAVAGTNTAAVLGATYAKKVGVNIADYASLKAAIAALPSTGGTVYVPVGRYPAGNWTYDTDYMSKANVRIVGEKKPRPSANCDRLEAGSIIYGRFNAFADGFHVENIGFDNGKYTVDTYFGAVDTHTGNHPLGGGWDAFAFAQPNMSTPLPNRRDCHFRHSIGLTRDSYSYGHAFLMEGVDVGSAGDITGIGGIHAVVVKSTNMKLGRLSGQAASNNNVIFKADTYAACGHLSAEYVESLTVPTGTTPWFTPAIAAHGLLINPASTSFSGPVQIDTFKVFGAGDGLCITGGGANVIGDLQIGAMVADGWTGAMTTGVNFFDTRAQRVQIGSLIVNNAVQGIAWNAATIGDNSAHQVSFGSVKLTNMSTRAINASGYARIRIDTNEVANTPQAYYCEDNARIMIGKETLINVGNRWERNNPTLSTGWTNFGGGNSNWEVKPENYGVAIKGLLNAATGVTGIIATLPTYLQPTEGKRLPAAITKSNVPQFAQIGLGTNGNIDLNNNAAPNVGDYLSVDGIGWQHW